MDRRRIRGIPEYLDIAVSVLRNMEHFAHAEIGKFDAVFKGEHDLTALVFIHAYPAHDLEEAFPRLHRIRKKRKPVIAVAVKIDFYTGKGIPRRLEFGDLA